MRLEPITDLEGLDRSSVFDISGHSYVAFRKELSASPLRAWLEIGAAYLALAAVCFLLAYYPVGFPAGIFLSLLGGACIGYGIAFLHLFLHEAAHGHLAYSRAANDRLADIFLGPILFTTVEFYRVVHMAHHRGLGTPKDSERSYFEPLTLSFLLQAFCGAKVLQVFKRRSQDLPAPASLRGRQRRFFLIGALSHLAFFVFLLVFGSVIAAFAWGLGVFAFTPLYGAVRQLLEHRPFGVGTENLERAAHSRCSRVFASGIIGSTFGGAGFNRHLLHHWDPTVPYSRLKDVEVFVLRTTLAEPYRAARTSYFRVFRELLKDAYQQRTPAVLELRTTD